MGKGRDGMGRIYTDKRGQTWVQLPIAPSGAGRGPARRAKTESENLDARSSRERTGVIDLNEITPEAIQQMVDTMTRASISPGATRQALNALRATYAYMAEEATSG